MARDEQITLAGRQFRIIVTAVSDAGGWWAEALALGDDGNWHVVRYEDGGDFVSAASDETTAGIRMHAKLERHFNALT